MLYGHFAFPLYHQLPALEGVVVPKFCSSLECRCALGGLFSMFFNVLYFVLQLSKEKKIISYFMKKECNKWAQGGWLPYSYLGTTFGCLTQAIGGVR